MGGKAGCSAAGGAKLQLPDTRLFARAHLVTLGGVGCDAPAPVGPVPPGLGRGFQLVLRKGCQPGQAGVHIGLAAASHRLKLDADLHVALQMQGGDLHGAAHMSFSRVSCTQAMHVMCSSAGS